LLVSRFQITIGRHAALSLSIRYFPAAFSVDGLPVITPNAARILPPIEAFEANLSARFSSNVKIDGAVRLRFVPRPQIIIEQVSLSDRRPRRAIRRNHAANGD
jgi:hypothetical protein